MLFWRKRQPDPGEFAYLFERFPSFTQTFCFREVLQMRALGLDAPAFSIRQPNNEPTQAFPPGLVESTTRLPENFDSDLANDANFRRAARAALADLERVWGDQSEKRRIYEALWLKRIFAERKIRRIHVHFAGIATRTAFWLKRLAGVRYSFTAHANDVFCDEPSDRLRMLIAEAEFVSTVSDFSVQYLQKLFPEHAAKFVRIYNGIPLDSIPPRPHAVSPPRIVSVGRAIEKKGFTDLIAACAELSPREFECQIIGEGPLIPELQTQIDRLGLAPRVQLTGPKTIAEIFETLSGARIFALPCVDCPNGGKDNLPTVIMEAMACSLPVISTPVAGVPEMVIDGETGYLVDPHNPGALAAKLANLLDHPDQAAALGKAGRTRCESLFASEVTAKQLHDQIFAHPG